MACVQVSAAAIPEALMEPSAETELIPHPHPEVGSVFPLRCCTACRSATQAVCVLMLPCLNSFRSVVLGPRLRRQKAFWDALEYRRSAAVRRLPRPADIVRLERASRRAGAERQWRLRREIQMRLACAVAASAARVGAALCDRCCSTKTQTFCHLSNLRSLSVQVQTLGNGTHTCHCA